MPHPGLLHPVPEAGCWPAPPQETLRHSSVSVSVGVSGFWCAQGLFEPSEHLLRIWCLILNMISPLLLSCWGLSFVLGCGVSPHSQSSTVQLLLQCLASCWGFSALGHGVSPHSHSQDTHPSYISNGHPWIWLSSVCLDMKGISSGLPLLELHLSHHTHRK